MKRWVTLRWSSAFLERVSPAVRLADACSIVRAVPCQMVGEGPRGIDPRCPTAAPRPAARATGAEPRTDELRGAPIQPSRITPRKQRQSESCRTLATCMLSHKSPSSDQELGWLGRGHSPVEINHTSQPQLASPLPPFRRSQSFCPRCIPAAPSPGCRCDPRICR